MPRRPSTGNSQCVGRRSDLPRLRGRRPAAGKVSNTGLFTINPKFGGSLVSTADSATDLLVGTLKREFKARSLGYADVAAQLGVSEATVKRYLRGQGLSVQILERMATLIGLDFLSLAQAAQDSADNPLLLTQAQEQVLRSDRDIFTVYFLLSHGLNPRQIVQEFGIGARQLETHLVKLEKLGVIRRLSTRIKVMTRTQFGETLHGRLNAFSVGSARQFLNEVDLHDEHCSWAFYSLPLSAESVERLRQMVAKVVDEMRALSRKEITLPADKRQWYRLFAGVAPINPRSVFRRR
jgi:transcriptional regulator with XRE-family HTH domain